MRIWARVWNMEEYGLIVDFLPYGKATDTRKEPLAQVVGENFFTLLEVVPKENAQFNVGEKVYIGKNEREKIDHIKSRITFDDLTGSARNELKNVISAIVKSREKEYVNFFNKCGPVTIRLHQLELLPGVGKKHMADILSERDKKPFESFSDINSRVPLLPDPVHLIAQRVEEEMRGDSKYYILTRPPQIKRM